jgi:hypothetical protein
MSSAFYQGFRARFDASSWRHAFAPRKPRNALLRVAFGLLGIALLVVLLGVGLVVGATMLAFGLLRRLAGRRPHARPADGRVVDGEYRVVQKPLLR